MPWRRRDQATENDGVQRLGERYPANRARARIEVEWLHERARSEHHHGTERLKALDQRGRQLGAARHRVTGDSRNRDPRCEAVAR
jgi:hypothetical protein